MYIAEERIWAWGYLNRNPKTEKQREKHNIQKLWNNYENIWIIGIPEEEKEKETEVFETIMSEGFPQINVRHQTTEPGSSENTRQGRCQQMS